jgi:hypothetical protein
VTTAVIDPLMDRTKFNLRKAHTERTGSFHAIIWYDRKLVSHRDSQLTHKG